MNRLKNRPDQQQRVHALIKYRTTICLLLSLLALVPASAFGEEQSDEDAERGEHDGEDADAAGEVRADGAAWEVTTPGSVAVRAGAFSGHYYRPASGGVSELAAEVDPGMQRGDFELRAPLDFEYRETYGAELREIDGQIDLEGRWTPVEGLRIEPAAELARTWRLGWPDLYQPLPGTPANPPVPPTDFATTDRHGYLSWELGAGIDYRFSEGQSVEFSYQFDATIYDKDPNYSSIQDVDPEPTHLVPYDNLAHEFFLRWRYRQANWRVGAKLDLETRDYEYVYARDAHTGETHAAPGGPPPNPLYSVLEYEPAVEGRVELVDNHLTLNAELGWHVHDDRYQGYYTYSGIHPDVGASWEFDGGSEIGADLEVEWRTYGPNSYEATAGWQPGDSGHPPLEFGDRRVDHRIDVDLDAETPLTDDLLGTLSASMDWRDTNFPDYEPGVFPRTRNYDIQWSYTNFEILAGMEYGF